MARRSRGEGSIYFDKGLTLWRGSVVYTDAVGTKKTKYFSAKRKKEVKDKIQDFILNLKPGNHFDDGITIASWIDIWLEHFVKPTVKFSTYRIYKSAVTYVKVALGDRQLKKLTTLDLQGYFQDMREKGGVNGRALSATTVNSTRRYLKMCCESAVKNNILEINPVEGTKPLRQKKKPIVVIDEKQVSHFLEVVKKGDYIFEGISNRKLLTNNSGKEFFIQCYYALVVLALGSGMRISEIRGLTWDDINFEKQYVDVHKQLVKTYDDDEFDEPKTEHAYRKIKLDEEVLRILADYKAYQGSYADYLGALYDNNLNLLFTNTLGKPINLTNFRKRYFKKMVKAAGISENFTIHCMRHTHATLLLKHGVNAKVVSERLGHSSVIVTLNVYAHVLEKMEDSAPMVWKSITTQDYHTDFM